MPREVPELVYPESRLTAASQRTAIRIELGVTGGQIAATLAKDQEQGTTAKEQHH
jgi:hypothetical protein